jgi:membrane fusion protein, multidrug efflux system
MNSAQRIALAALLVIALPVTGCRKKAEAQDLAKNKDQAIRVETAKVQRGPIEAILKHSTHLEAEEEVKVFARTANRVTELLVEEGDEVEKNQLLLRLNDDIQKTAHDKALVRFEKAQQEFDRQQKLFQQNLISQQVFNDAHFELRQLQLALDDAKRELEFTQVRAPIGGTISRRMVKYGELVNLNQHLFDIVDFDSIVARIYLPEQNLPDLQVGLPARVTSSSLGRKEFPGFVRRVAPIVEAKSGLVKVTIGFKEPKFLRPGLFVDVELVTSKKSDALLISKRALVYDGELSYVFRLLPERKVERVAVLPRVADKNFVEPLSGFSEGDEIVVAGQTGLKDGVKVRLPGDIVAGDSKTNAAEEAKKSTGKKS